MIRIYICSNTDGHKWAKCGDVTHYDSNAIKPYLDTPPICSICTKQMKLLTSPYKEG